MTPLVDTVDTSHWGWHDQYHLYGATYKWMNILPHLLAFANSTQVAIGQMDFYGWRKQTYLLGGTG